LIEETREIEEEVRKIDQVDESFLARRLRNIGRMAPDILEVILSTLSRPTSVVSTVAKKVAAKIKAET